MARVAHTLSRMRARASCPFPPYCTSIALWSRRRRCHRPPKKSRSLMPIERIDGPDDPRVTAFREVPDAERLRADGLFVAEGRLIVQRVVEDRRYRVQAVLANSASLRALAPLFARSAPDMPVYVAERGDFEALTGHD